jgi:hypothetical protein
MEYSDLPVSMTEIFANKQAVDDFGEVNKFRGNRRPSAASQSSQGRHLQRSIDKAPSHGGDVYENNSRQQSASV